MQNNKENTRLKNNMQSNQQKNNQNNQMKNISPPIISKKRSRESIQINTKSNTTQKNFFKNKMTQIFGVLNENVIKKFKALNCKNKNYNDEELYNIIQNFYRRLNRYYSLRINKKKENNNINTSNEDLDIRGIVHSYFLNDNKSPDDIANFIALIAQNICSGIIK